ncbi:MAG: tRNA lysidine(34) synthetase TilS [Propionibacteriaceae bacterium]|nr:tRNA lysidine(34) synthetase TilS [Propionibacteriaceae bacterium]
MAKRGLSAECLAVVAAVRACLPSDSATRHVVRIALSGGADSLSLAAGLAWLDAHEPDPLRTSEAVVVDHDLQPGSADIAEAAAAAVQNFGLSATVVKVHVTESGVGVEAAARDARYTALATAHSPSAVVSASTSEAADEFGTVAPALVLVGHTMDDQAETVLMGLARGSGTRSLAGMPARFTVAGIPFARPLLALRRATTAQACVDWDLTPWQDPMNADPRFLRVRVRHEIIPALDDVLGPGVVDALARTAHLAQEDADFLDSLVPVASPGPLPVAQVANLPRPLATRLIRDWLNANGVVELGFAHTASVYALVADWHGQSGVNLPGTCVSRAAGELRLSQR